MDVINLEELEAEARSLHLPEDASYPIDAVLTLIQELRRCLNALKEIKSGEGRAERLGLDLSRCPTCASAEIASSALEETKKVIEL